MIFYGIVIVGFIGFTAWFVRTPTFKAHRNGHGRDPGEQGTRVEGKYGPLGGTFNGPDKGP